MFLLVSVCCDSPDLGVLAGVSVFDSPDLGVPAGVSVL